MPETPNSESVSTRQQRIAMLAKRSPQTAFISLNHYLDLDWLREAFHRTRKDGTPGVDGQTWAGYAENLEENLQSLLGRAKSGTYRAPPVQRAYIPKGTGGETRPIGIPTLEDKVLQRAVVMVLESIYEQDFHDGSYGFRPGRSAHQALESLWTQTMQIGGGWILEVDIRKFFDTLDHGHASEAFWEVRPDDPSGEDQTSTVPAPVLFEFAERRPRGRSARDVRSTWLHALLEPFQERQLGGKAEDGGQPFHSGSQDDCPMVPEPPASTDRRAAPGTWPEAARPLCLLRDHGQLGCPEPIP